MQSYDVNKAFELAEVLVRHLRRDIYCGLVPMACDFALTEHQTPFSERKNLQYRPMKSGKVWGINGRLDGFILREECLNGFLQKTKVGIKFQFTHVSGLYFKNLWYLFRTTETTENTEKCS